MRGSEFGPWWLAATVLIVGCNVSAQGRSTGGVSLDGGAARLDGGGDGAIVDEARGIVVVNTAYGASMMASLLSPSGDVRSAAFIGSRSAAPGLSAAFSGDVVLPSMRVPGNEVVLVDRANGKSVLTWVNLENPDMVRAQLSVAQGFWANPHDYVPYTANKAFVTRWGPTLDADRRPFDKGSDLLVIDPSVPEITGSIDLAPAFDGESADYYPHPHRSLMARGKVRVVAQGFQFDATKVALDSRVVTIDPESESIEQVLVVEGIKGCEQLERSPDGTKLAVGCSGTYYQDPALGFPDSGVVVFDVADELTEVRRFTAREWGTEQISGVAWTSNTTLLVSTTGRLDENQAVVAKDALRFLDLDAGVLEKKPILNSATRAFVLGEAPLCDIAAATCIVTDAEAKTKGGQVHVFSIDADGRASETRTFQIDTGTGDPPRYLGRY